ncbi:Cupin [Filomicrobium insigne]|uniref:Cupin n=1 Tax=Filomicrobium insigne TaxID=418854 RepID=A0A1H0S8R9_9HYPH|nr:cupin domain-containing protein [Filomicrobium insigne]SDP38045.1 Cupin [Filomicrobium insigne]
MKRLVAAILIALAGPAYAENTAHDAKELVPTDIKFEDNPAFPKGAQTVVVYGDPSKPGMFILRLKMPPNYIVPPHIHPVFESVTVLSGTMGSGMGKTVEKSKGKLLGPGSLLLLPADHPHYVWSEEQETIIQVTAIGPFDLIYVNPEDDPRNK